MLVLLSEIFIDFSAWSTVKAQSENIAIAKDPWNTSAEKKNESDTWADFSSATFEADFTKAFENQFPTNSKMEINEQTFSSTAMNEEPEKIGEVKTDEQIVSNNSEEAVKQSDVTIVNTSVTDTPQKNEFINTAETQELKFLLDELSLNQPSK